MKIILKYFIEGLVIFSSVLFSLYIGNINSDSQNYKSKNLYINDLVDTLNDDILQIENLLEILYESEVSINTLQNDIDQNHQLMTDQEAIETLIKVEVGISFFPKDGVYNQMISTGTFELIESDPLKNYLLEMYNHLKDRNYATSTEIDNFNLAFRRSNNEKFRIRFDYDLLDGQYYGSSVLTSFRFNDTFYNSNMFYGFLSQAKLYSNMYERLLKDILNFYKTALELASIELQN